jgi:hypothetical protein
LVRLLPVTLILLPGDDDDDHDHCDCEDCDDDCEDENCEGCEHKHEEHDPELLADAVQEVKYFEPEILEKEDLERILNYISKLAHKLDTNAQVEPTESIAEGNR